MPAVLQQLARHAHISTTMTYYVSKIAEETAKAAWDAVRSNTSGNTAGEQAVVPNEDIDLSC